jgi:hypothetical protein
VARPLKAAELLRPTLAALLLVSLPMCARPGRPPGGPRDVMPPQVVETFPEVQGQMEELGDEVVIIFNERISERPSSGTFEQAVVVSPEVSDLKVSHRSDGISLSVPGGWRAQQVYRVRVLPVLQDLFQNRMVGPFEFVFGTGMGFSESVIVGIVEDRLTGEPVKDVRVTARQVGAGGGDLPLFVSPTDSLGIYAMRWMVQGSYDLVAFTDINRNREADPFEQIGTGQAGLGRRDTTIVNLTILRPDTTPAVVGRVEVADSATLRVSLDDFVAQEDPLDAVSVVISSDSATAPAVLGVIHEGAYQDTVKVREEAARVAAAEAAALEAEAAALEAAAAAAADTTSGAAEEGVIPAEEDVIPPEVEAGADATADSTRSAPAPRLPKQEFFILLADSLQFDVQYVVQIEGITNINGLALGSGVDTIVRTSPPPAPDTDVADSTGVVPDSAQVLPDTARGRR